MTALISPTNLYRDFGLDNWSYTERYYVVNRGEDWVELMVNGQILAFELTEVIE